MRVQTFTMATVHSGEIVSGSMVLHPDSRRWSTGASSPSVGWSALSDCHTCTLRRQVGS